MYISITTIVLIAIILILIGVVAVLLLKPKKTQIIEKETKVIVEPTDIHIVDNPKPLNVISNTITTKKIIAKSSSKPISNISFNQKRLGND
ncbi:hypothetical protein [Rhizosphaericola mali]|uniref:Uncharacterized protein n=1 Tax=Rhizosphaericola mali TaxID=2545455 RepID=A0A5P2FZ63_9BACT|nr:hypothetical protein [Rhizosphaericola mali]QES88816.1 hypothetical protein E0W69_009175 [Rhizosphaericola mali]